MAKTKVEKIAECGAVVGTGDTQTEAKADLARKVKEALTGSYQPVMVHYGAYTALVYRTPTGWGYRMLHDLDADGIQEVGYAIDTGNGTKDEAIQAAAGHVLDIGHGLDEFHADEDIPAWLTDKAGRSNVLTNARFRRAYAWVKEHEPEIAEGKWHQWACDHSHEKRFA
jgi:hypothetical protein